MPPKVRRPAAAVPKVAARGKAKAKAKAKAGARAPVRAKAKAKAGAGLLRRGRFGVRKKPAKAEDKDEPEDPLEQILKAEELTLHQCKGLQEIIVEEGTYWGSPISATLRVKKVEIVRGDVYLVATVLGTQNEGLLRAASGLPKQEVLLHLCGRDCNGAPTADDVIHVRTLKKLAGGSSRGLDEQPSGSQRRHRRGGSVSPTSRRPREAGRQGAGEGSPWKGGWKREEKERQELQQFIKGKVQEKEGEEKEKEKEVQGGRRKRAGGPVQEHRARPETRGPKAVQAKSSKHGPQEECWKGVQEHRIVDEQLRSRRRGSLPVWFSQQTEGDRNQAPWHIERSCPGGSHRESHHPGRGDLGRPCRVITPPLCEVLQAEPCGKDEPGDEPRVPYSHPGGGLSPQRTTSRSPGFNHPKGESFGATEFRHPLQCGSAAGTPATGVDVVGNQPRSSGSINAAGLVTGIQGIYNWNSTF